MRTRRSLATGLLISAVTLLVCLGGLELAGYVWESSTAQGPLGWTLVASRRMPLARHGAAERPYYLLQPNGDYLWEGIPVHINSRGFRTEEFLTPKPPGEYRILNIGDSVAFGWEVRLEDTYGKQLESMLNNEGRTPRYEVINAAVPGWTIETERNYLLEEGLNYEPDVVLLDVTVVNDIYGHGPGAQEKASLFQWMRDHTHAWPFLTTEARFLLAQRYGPEAIPVLNPPREASAYFPLDETDPIWHALWAPIQEMAQACRQAGVRFEMVIFPTAFQLSSDAHPDVPQRVLGGFATEAGVEFLDLLPTYRQACDAKPGACEGYENLLFADVWMHPNRLGHRLAAEALLSAESSRGIRMTADRAGGVR
jgi:hypothetical protein